MAAAVPPSASPPGPTGAAPHGPPPAVDGPHASSGTTEAIGTAADDGAPGWAGLWSDLLAVHAGRALPAPTSDPDDGADRAPVPPRPVHDATAGWTLRPAAAGALAERFALYKPLLDARQVQRARAGGPWVVAQLGQSLDGCIATASGDSAFVTGPPSLTHLHRLRALCDAVLVGAGTVAADDPRLTTRRVPGPQPVRVVIDPAARLDGRARVFRDGAAPTLWLCDARHAAQARVRLGGEAEPAARPMAQAMPPASQTQTPSPTPQRRSAPETPTTPSTPMGPSTIAPATAEVLAVPGLLDPAAPVGGWRPAAVVAALAARGLRLLFVEGGGVTVSAFLAAGALDRLHLVVAPVLIGDGRRGLQGLAPAAMADCLRPPARVLALGDDRLWDLDLSAPAPPG